MQNVQDSTEERQETLTQGSGIDWKSLLSKNTTLLIAAAVGIVVIVVGYAVYSSYSATKNQQANLALSRIRSYVDAGNYEAALAGDSVKKVRGEDIIGLRAIVDEFSSADAGKTAALWAAEASVSLSKFEDAERYYDIAESSSSDIVSTAAMAGLATIKERNQSYSEAAKLYAKVIDKSSNLGTKDKYLYYGALCAEKANDKETAVKYLKNLIAEFEFSKYSGEAKSKLTALGMVLE